MLRLNSNLTVLFLCVYRMIEENLPGLAPFFLKADFSSGKKLKASLERRTLHDGLLVMQPGKVFLESDEGLFDQKVGVSRHHLPSQYTHVH